MSASPSSRPSPQDGQDGQSGQGIAADRRKKRATAVRVFVYVAVTHLWAALLLAMFAVGRR
jgi:hypothetical protein